MATGDLFRARDLPPVIAERIKEAREARGFTRELFAERLGISTQAVGQYEVGQHTPGPEIFQELFSWRAYRRRSFRQIGPAIASEQAAQIGALSSGCRGRTVCA